MIYAGMEAVLIKVAGIGLKPIHLGKTLAEMQPTLIKLVSYLRMLFKYGFDGIFSQNNLYGSHICGEGGEYETLTLDCPLFKNRIKL